MTDGKIFPAKPVAHFFVIAFLSTNTVKKAKYSVKYVEKKLSFRMDLHIRLQTRSRSGRNVAVLNSPRGSLSTDVALRSGIEYANPSENINSKKGA